METKRTIADMVKTVAKQSGMYWTVLKANAVSMESDFKSGTTVYTFSDGSKISDEGGELTCL